MGHVAQEDLLLLHGLIGGLLGGHQLFVLLRELGGAAPDALFQAGIELEDLDLVPLALGDVAAVDDDAADGGISGGRSTVPRGCARTRPCGGIGTRSDRRLPGDRPGA